MTDDGTVTDSGTVTGGGAEMEEKRETSLEENFAKLEELIALLESDDISLEDAFGAYSQGMGILKQCGEQIDRVEKQVLRLSGDGQIEEFENGSEGI